MKLYHVSFDLTERLYKEFTPRIPENPDNGEDETISRICFSDSIQGCIRAICGYPKEDPVDIIVWEHEFQESEVLRDWKYLYENNLVPDAAVTHEYWYLDKITLDGSTYRLSAIEHRVFFAIRPEYKDKILQILSVYMDNLTVFDDMDPCFIINEWLPANLPVEADEIIDQVEDALTYEKVDDDPDGEEIGRMIFGDDYRSPTKTIPDYDFTDMMTSYKIISVENK